MSTVFKNLPFPAGNAAGAAVATDDMELSKTFSIDGAFDGIVFVEGGSVADGWANVCRFDSPDEAEKTIEGDYPFLRIRRQGGSTPALSATVGVGAQSTEVTTLHPNVPAGTGTGAAQVLPSNAGLRKTFSCLSPTGAPLSGIVFVDITEDGTTWDPAIRFDNTGATKVLDAVAAQCRVRRVDANAAAPAPVIVVSTQPTDAAVGQLDADCEPIINVTDLVACPDSDMRLLGASGDPTVPGDDGHDVNRFSGLGIANPAGQGGDGGNVVDFVAAGGTGTGGSGGNAGFANVQGGAGGDGDPNGGRGADMGRFGGVGGTGAQQGGKGGSIIDFAGNGGQGGQTGGTGGDWTRVGGAGGEGVTDDGGDAGAMVDTGGVGGAGNGAGNSGGNGATQQRIAGDGGPGLTGADGGDGGAQIDFAGDGGDGNANGDGGNGGNRVDSAGNGGDGGAGGTGGNGGDRIIDAGAAGTGGAGDGSPGIVRIAGQRAGRQDNGRAATATPDDGAPVRDLASQEHPTLSVSGAGAAATTLDSRHDTFVTDGGALQTLNLPLIASCPGRQYTGVIFNGGSISFARAGGDTIDGLDGSTSSPTLGLPQSIGTFASGVELKATGVTLQADAQTNRWRVVRTVVNFAGGV